MHKGKQVRDYYARLREESRGKPFLQIMAAVSAHLLKKCFATNTSTWYSLPLTDPLPRLQPRLAVTFGFMRLEEAVKFFRENHSAFPWMYIGEEIETATKCGHLFPCFRMDGKIVAYQKLGLSQVYVLDFKRVLHLPSGTAFSYDAFVDPSCRGMGLGAAILSYSSHHLKQQGYLAISAQIPQWNVPSVKMTMQAGFRPIGTVRYIQVAGKEFFHKRPRQLPLCRERYAGSTHELRLGPLTP